MVLHRIKKRILSDSAQDGFLASIVILSFFFLAFNFYALQYAINVTAVAINIMYILALSGYIALMTGKSRSYTLKRIMILFSFIAVPCVVILLALFSYTFLFINQ